MTKKPKKPVSSRKAEELEDKEAPRRVPVGDGEVVKGGDVRLNEDWTIEDKEAPRRMPSGGDAAPDDPEAALELEDKEAPRRMPGGGDAAPDDPEATLELEDKEAPRKAPSVE